MKQQRTSKKDQSDRHESKEELGAHDQDRVKKDKDGAQQQNTIIQQINGFAMTPMNDRIAAKTIEDHKYLLELVENKAAIAYFAVANRN